MRKISILVFSVISLATSAQAFQGTGESSAPVAVINASAQTQVSAVGTHVASNEVDLSRLSAKEGAPADDIAAVNLGQNNEAMPVAPSVVFYP